METNADGRTDKPLLVGEAMTVGRYQLVFHVAEYFSKLGVQLPNSPFLDKVPVQFSIFDAKAHYHVPLLTTPWSPTYSGLTTFARTGSLHSPPLPFRGRYMFEIEAVNRMDRQAFVRAFGKVFEHSPWVAERAWSSRPFDGLTSLHRAMADVVRSGTSEERLALLRAHPELAGKEARAKAMTEDSARSNVAR
jgi:hypothetical protein